MSSSLTAYLPLGTVATLSQAATSQSRPVAEHRQLYRS